MDGLRRDDVTVRLSALDSSMRSSKCSHSSMLCFGLVKDRSSLDLDSLTSPKIVETSVKAIRSSVKVVENGEELLRKGLSQQTKQRTGLALLSDPMCGDQQRKRNGRADIKATKRMAGSNETREPHVHAWRTFSADSLSVSVHPPPPLCNRMH